MFAPFCACTATSHPLLPTATNNRLPQITNRQQIEEGEQPGEMYAALQYQVLDKRTPSLDANSKKKIKRLQTEHGRYLRVSGVTLPIKIWLSVPTCGRDSRVEGCQVYGLLVF